MNISPPLRPRAAAAAVLGALACLMAACSDAAPVAQPSTPPPPAATVSPTPARQIERRAISLPADDAAHAALTEWWYYNGHVATASGDTYSFHLVVFKRQGGQGAPARAAYVAHAGITDHQRRIFRYDQAVVVPPTQPALLNRFDVSVGGVTLRGGDGVDEVTGTAGEFSLRLSLRTAKPPVIHGDAGIVGVSPEELSYYYSRTRMAAVGELSVAGMAQPVQGLAWMDHQWGEFSLPGAAGWDWFAVHLDDGSDLMVSVLRDDAGKLITQYGTWVAPDGAATNLTAGQLATRSLTTWTSPATRATYPMGWVLETPSAGLAVELEPVTPEQEMDTTATTGKVYWEGAVRARGTLAGRPIGGYGYVELTGYKERTAP